MSARKAPAGFPLLPVPDEGGELRFPSPEASVRQAIEVILRTRPGEQLLRPDFGAGLEDLVGEPNTLATRRRIRDLVTTALAAWEPRVAILRVDVLEVPDAPARVRVEIAYRPTWSRTPGLVGLTMDLGG